MAMLRKMRDDLVVKQYHRSMFLSAFPINAQQPDDPKPTLANPGRVLIFSAKLRCVMDALLPKAWTDFQC